MAPRVLPILCGIYLIVGYMRTTAQDVCKTADCEEKAKRILSSMNKSVNPCDDFYQFACGTYVKNTVVPPNKLQNSAFMEIQDVINAQLRTIMDQPVFPDEPHSFQMVKNLYRTCIDESSADKRGNQFMVDIINKAGGWPVLQGNKWDAANWEWTKCVYEFHEVGMDAGLFQISITVDIVKSDRRMVEIDQGHLGLNRRFLIEGRTSHIVQAYGIFMVDIAKALGAYHQDAVTEMAKALDLEMEIAKFSLSDEDKEDLGKVYHPVTYAGLKNKHPIVNWDDYLSHFLVHINKLEDSENLLVNSPTFLDEMQKLLEKTDKRTLANLLVWRAICTNLGTLTADIRERQKAYATIFTGRFERTPRSQTCALLVAGGLPAAVGHLYLKEFFNPTTKSEFIEMVKTLQDEVLNMVMALSWMENASRGKAAIKASNIIYHLGYPDEVLNLNIVEDFYRNLEITGEYFFESLMNLTRFSWFTQVTRLREPVNKTDWKSHADVTVARGVYHPVENSIIIPAAMIQYPYFSIDVPKYLNYASLGLLAAHELTHAIDHVGQQFDENGNLDIWITEKSVENYRKKINCFIKKADSYLVKDVNLTLMGKNIEVEDLAINSGYLNIYNAYNRWAKASGKEEPRLRGLEQYNIKQLFWLTAANMWCTAYRPEVLDFLIRGSFNPPAEYRVNGPLRNFKSFAEDFNCPKNSPMNPSLKCRMWS